MALAFEFLGSSLTLNQSWVLRDCPGRAVEAVPHTQSFCTIKTFLPCALILACSSGKPFPIFHLLTECFLL
jgi:hypothetical protein